MEVPQPQLPREQQLTLWEYYHQPQAEQPLPEEEVYGNTSIVPEETLFKQSAD
jgi:hypothetical protein